MSTTNEHLAEPVKLPISTQDVRNMEKRISYLKLRAQKSQVNAKKGFRDQLKAAEDQFKLIEAKLNKAKKHTTLVTSEVQSGFRKAWKDLKSSVDAAAKHLH